ncbi:DUF421 domain-containing protein [Aneurinibacillus terranovensis]|uniref:DUF421 domain-containing protein n=1 Tax=Aneurinibacillus terranovensis TaxID=278991 RepID=UPI00040F4C47
METLLIALRALFALIAMFIITRLSGKKQLSQMTFFEYIVGITIGDIAAFLSTDLEANLVHGYASLIVWAFIPMLVDYFALKSRPIRNFFEGKGTVLIKNGKIMEDNLKKERYSTDELMESLRLKNAFNIADVEFASLETNGQLSVLLKKDAQPVTLKDLQITAAPEREPQTVIMDGNILEEPLATLGFNIEWLHTELDKIGVNLANVFLGEVDSYGQLYVDLYDDKIKVPQPVQKQLLLATLKKSQADIELFSLQTKSKSAKKMYEEASNKLEKMLNELKPFLQ